jgi:hypothetical protein
LARRRRELDELVALRHRVESGAHESSAVRDLSQRLAHIEQNVLGKADAGRTSVAAGSEAGKAGTSVPADNKAYMFSGMIHGEIMSDMLQLVSSNSLTGIFSVTSETGSIRLYYYEGGIKHAEGQGLVGEQAFFAAFASREGRYSFEETATGDVEETITSNTQFLILEALRQIDEAQAEGGGG